MATAHEITAAIETAADWIATYEPSARRNDPQYSAAARNNARHSITRTLLEAAERGGLVAVMEAADREIGDRIEDAGQREVCRERVIRSLTPSA